MDPQPGGSIPLYAYVLLAFSLWMLVDAARRRAPAYWYFVILFLPFGAIVYFFFVKLRDFRGDRDSTPMDSSPSSTSGVAGSSPVAAAPNLERADKLEQEERYIEAEPLFRQALALDASNKQALHGLGRCLLGLERAKESLEFFERLLPLDREFRNFSAALDYADALWIAGQRNDTIELLEQLADHTGRINHRLALGHYLTEFGQVERARTEIARAIDEASKQPDAQQPKMRKWLDQGRNMLESLNQASDSST